MVAKISFGSSLYGALAYNGEKINVEKGKLLGTNKIIDEGTGRVDIRRAVADFKCYMPSQIRTEKPIIHISLNPHPDDNLTDVEMANIAQEYMMKLGYGNQPYMIFKHEDIDRHHIHIVSIRVDENGKCLNNAYNFRRSKAITRELEQKYGLHKAERQLETKQEYMKNVNLSDSNVKKQVENIIKSMMNYRFQNLGEYRALLSLYNVMVEEVKGEVRGREYHGLVYSATDDKGNKVGNPFKSSRFGKSVGYEALEKHFAFSKEQIREKKLALETKIAVATALSQSTNRTEFIAALKAKGIDTVLREADTGRIYGATYIDHNTGCVFNGYRLGKVFSANALQEHFISDSSNKKSLESNREELSEKKSFQEQENDFSSQNDLYNDNVGLFSFDTQAVNDVDEALIRKMQQRKRKRKRFKN